MSLAGASAEKALYPYPVGIKSQESKAPEGLHMVWGCLSYGCLWKHGLASLYELARHDFSGIVCHDDRKGMTMQTDW